MSTPAVAFAICVLSLSLLVACKGGDDDDSTPGMPTGTGGVVLSGSGGVGPANPGSGGVAAAASGGAGGSTVPGSGGAPSNIAGMGAAGMTGGAPTFTRVWSEVLVKKSCNSSFCHGMAQGMLSMRNKDDAYMNLVDAPAAGPKCGASGMLRVKRSEPMQSLLLDKISHAMPACGDPMPIGTKFPPNCLASTPEVCNTEPETTLVRDWIAAGALND